MATRITQAQIDALVDQINRATGHTTEPWTQDSTGRYRANVGTYVIDSAYGGVALSQLTSDGGGERTIIPRGTKKELHHALRAFLAGLQAARGNPPGEGPLTVELHGVSYVVVNPEDYNMHLGGGGGRVEALAWGIGAYGSIHLITLWHNMGDALEVVGGWLEDNAPGQLTTQAEMAELAKEAREELGPGAADEEVWEAAEVDLMYTESGWLPGWEVSAQEIHGEELRKVLLAALEYDEDIDQEDYQERLEELGGVRENFTPSEHRQLADEYRVQRGALRDIREIADEAGDQERAQAAYELGLVKGGLIEGHEDSSFMGGEIGAGLGGFGRLMEEAKATSQQYVHHVGRSHMEGVPPTRRSSGNPPAQWVERGKADWEIRPGPARTARKYGIVFRYTPRSLTTTGGVSKRLGLSYVGQLKKKVPPGTKYIAVIAYHGAAAMKILGAYKTLGPAKKKVEKELGLSGYGTKAKRNKPKGSRAQTFKVQVRSSTRARPVKLKLPGKAKATKIAGKVIHRSVSYAGRKLRLIKGWTVSTLAGVGVARFKTKAAAERHARK